MNDLKNKHAGETVAVVGCGPSLNDVDLNLLDGITTIGCKQACEAAEMNYLVWLDQRAALDGKPNKQFKEFLKSSARKFLAEEVPYDHGFETFKHYNEIEDVNAPVLSSAIEQGLFWSRTVIFPAINLAYIMGARRIVLLGLDMHDASHFDGSGSSSKPFLRAAMIMYDFARLAVFACKHDFEIVNVNSNSAVKSFQFMEFKDALTD